MLSLAARTKVRCAPPEAHAPYRAAAHSTRLACPTIHKIALLKESGLPFAVHVIPQGPSAFGDRVRQSVTHSVDQPVQPDPGNALGGSSRKYPRSKQCLVGIDVSDADNDPAIHQGELDGRGSGAGRAEKMVDVEGVTQGFGTECFEQRMVPGIAHRPEHRSKSPRVVVAQQHAVAELKIDMIVATQRRRCAVHAHASGHPEMDDQRAVLEAEEEVLASSLGTIDNVPHEAAREVAGNRPPQAAVVQPHCGHFLPFYVWRDSA